MLESGAALSTHPEAVQAASEAAAAALASAGIERAAGALLFATPQHAEAMHRALPHVRQVLGTQAVVGSSAAGVLAAGHEAEDGPGVAVLALAGVELHPFLLAHLGGREESAGDEIAARLPSPPTERDLVVLLPDGDSLARDPLLRGIERTLAPAALAGAAASAVSDGRPRLWCGEEFAREGLAGLVVRAASPARRAVTHSCQPSGAPLVVTRARGHWILEIDGRPALAAYRQAARAPLAADLRRAAGVLAIALERGAPPDAAWAVRSVSGIDECRGALALAEPVARGQRLAFALREADAARADLERTLDALAEPPPAAVLYFSCSARGSALFGFSGLEAAYLARAFDAAAQLGVFGSGALGPLGKRNEWLSHAAALALLDAPAPALR